MLTTVCLAVVATFAACINQPSPESSNTPESTRPQQQTRDRDRTQWAVRVMSELRARFERAELAATNYHLPPVPPEYLSEDPLNSLTDRILRLTDTVLRAEADRIVKVALYEEAKAGRIDRVPDAFGGLRFVPNQTVGEALKAYLERAARDEKMLKAALSLQMDQVAAKNQPKVQYFVLRRNVETGRSIYRDFIALAHESGIDLPEPESSQLALL